MTVYVKSMTRHTGYMWRYPLKHFDEVGMLWPCERYDVDGRAKLFAPSGKGRRR